MTIQFCKPEKGRQVKVITRHPSYIDNSVDWRDSKDNTYIGTVLEDIKWTKPGTFEMTGDPNDFKRIPTRQIALSAVAYLLYTDTNETVPLEEVTPNVKPIRWQVAGSKGKTYDLAKIDGEVTCTCPGFRFRGQCKHSKAGVPAAGV